MNILPILNTTPTPTDRPVVFYLRRDPVLTPRIDSETGIGVAINVDTYSFHIKTGPNVEWHCIDDDYKFCMTVSSYITGLGENTHSQSTIHAALMAHLIEVSKHMDAYDMPELRHDSWTRS